MMVIRDYYTCSRCGKGWGGGGGWAGGRWFMPVFLLFLDCPSLFLSSFSIFSFLSSSSSSFLFLPVSGR